MTTTENTKILTTEEVATRFNALAQQNQWFEIQDELFADHVTSDEPKGAPYFQPSPYAEGKAAVRKKGETWVAKVEAFHGGTTTAPVVGGNHFAVGKTFDMTVAGFGRIQIEEIMVYEVKNGQIISERFFY